VAVVWLWSRSVTCLMKSYLDIANCCKKYKSPIKRETMLKNLSTRRSQTHHLEKKTHWWLWHSGIHATNYAEFFWWKSNLRSGSRQNYQRVPYTQGDQALKQWTLSLDGTSLTHFRISPEEIQTSIHAISSEIKAALQLIIDRVRTFHQR